MEKNIKEEQGGPITSLWHLYDTALEYCIQFWLPYSKQILKKLERVPRTMGMVCGPENTPFNED